MTAISVVIETYNLDSLGDAVPPHALRAAIDARVAALALPDDVEVIVTLGARPGERALGAETAFGDPPDAVPSPPDHRLAGRSAAAPVRTRLARSALARHARTAGRWRAVAMPARAGYYDHKNAGFAAARGDIVAFLDGDCAPAPGWLAAITAPILAGEARVVAGATSYPGALAGLANRLDFPYFDRDRPRTVSAGDGDAPARVRNFFANNVAFARDAFAAGYPAIPNMFHGQCQILAMQLAARAIWIAYAPAARVTHAYPGSPRAWLAARLLRGADTRALLPFVAETYAKPLAPAIGRLGPLPAWALFGVRAIANLGRSPISNPNPNPTPPSAPDASPRASRFTRPLAAALLAAVTLVDAIGAAAGARTYRWLGTAS